MPANIMCKRFASRGSAAALARPRSRDDFERGLRQHCNWMRCNARVQPGQPTKVRLITDIEGQVLWEVQHKEAGRMLTHNL